MSSTGSVLVNAPPPVIVEGTACAGLYLAWVPRRWGVIRRGPPPDFATEYALLDEDLRTNSRPFRRPPSRCLLTPTEEPSDL